MGRLFLSLCLCVFCLLISYDNSKAEVLKASIADSTGIVGLDMIVGAEPVPIIRNVFIGTPAYNAGLHQGDRIVAINNEKTYGMSSIEVDNAISDVPGETVALTIIRNNNLLSFNLTVVPLHLISENTQKAYQPY